MPSTFLGLEIGRRALAASQTALDTVGHNTSNINTIGYSRQIVNFETSDPYTIPGPSNPLLGQIGTGVMVSSITRIRDEFIDRRVFDATSSQGALNNLSNILNRVQEVFNEPSDAGIGGLMTQF